MIHFSSVAAHKGFVIFFYLLILLVILFSSTFLKGENKKFLQKYQITSAFLK